MQLFEVYTNKTTLKKRETNKYGQNFLNTVNKVNMHKINSRSINLNLK